MTTTQTIIQQLGGNRIFAMAFDRATADEAKSTVYLRIAPALKRCLAPVAGKKPTHVRVTLDESDTYTVDVLSVGKCDAVGTSLKCVSFVYGDQLAGVVEAETGLRLSL